MKYNLNEIVNKSIMSHIPSVFVEGRDDIQIYQRILKLDNLKVDIYPAEIYLDKENGGCQAVVEIIKVISSNRNLNQLKNLVLSISDKDVLDYRNECISSELIYYLRFYSIESFFVNICSLKEAFSAFTDANISLLDSIDYESFFRDIEADLIDRLLLISLECLKKSIDSDYDACITYGGNWESYKNELLITKLKNKESELLDFKTSIGLPDGLLGLQLICKGKWLIENYARAC